MKNKIIITGVIAIILWWLATVLAFNPIITEKAQLNQAITAEITILENQELDNKFEWGKLQDEIDVRKEAQKIYENANIELRKQKQELLDEKQKLFQ